MRLLTTLVLLAVTLPARAEITLVAVASNFVAPLEEIVSVFGPKTGHRVGITQGASGKFYAQITQGAPYEAFFSADQEKPLKLEEAGLIVPGSRFTYAEGQLVLWSAYVDQPVAPKVLKDDTWQKLSIANPKLAPYGRATMETLASLGVEEVTRERLVTGENVAQAFIFAEMGSAELGFVALSQVYRNGRFTQGSGWRVPVEYHSPIRQDAVLLKRAANRKAAKALLEFMKGPEAKAILKIYGYRVDN